MIQAATDAPKVKAVGLKKEQMLNHWRTIPDGANLDPDPVPYKHEGSTYSEDGIRITGRRAWIDSVLSQLKPLLRFENGQTRLQVVYKQSTDRQTGIPMDSWNCYVQVHERGGDARAINALFGFNG